MWGYKLEEMIGAIMFAFTSIICAILCVSYYELGDDDFNDTEI